MWGNSSETGKGGEGGWGPGVGLASLAGRNLLRHWDSVARGRRVKAALR